MSDDSLSKFDVIVDAFGTSPDKANDQVVLAQKLVELASENHQRLIFILGAGSLVTGADHHRGVEDIAKVPGSEAWINTPRQQLKELTCLETVKDVDWVGNSPSLSFIPGKAAGHYVIGCDDLLFNDEGKSEVTARTMAQLIVNEIMQPSHHQERITVINA